MTAVHESISRNHTLILVLLAAIAVVGVMAVPWSHVTPLSVGLSSWWERISPVVTGGDLFTAIRSEAGTSLPGIVISILFAAPFLAFPATWAGRRGSNLGRTIGLLFLALSLPAFLGASPDPASPLGWASALVILGTSLAGILLCYLALLLQGHVSTPSVSRRAFTLLVGVTGIAIATYVLLPLGIVLLVPTYVLMSVFQWRTYLQTKPRERQAEPV
ncbi:hypothetical protein KKG90_00275 [Candidatus Bipolaricaulota bacterium]|nr:hypothetical protein [Candidatus Bipolaricaulota bacterium]